LNFLGFSLHTIKGDGGILTIEVIFVEAIVVGKTNSRVKNMIKLDIYKK
jgi:hypothetical protein